VQQLLWLETLLKFGAGLPLALVPLSTLRLLGLPRPEQGFWPRLCGILLLGLAAATFIEGRAAGSGGLGLAGCIIINLCGAAMLSTLLVMDRGPSAARGRFIVWAVIVVLVVLSLFEIAKL
jgi:hypothetical protein